MHGRQSNSLASHLSPNHLTGDLLLNHITRVVNVHLDDQISAFKSTRLCVMSNVSNNVPPASRAECSCQVPVLLYAVHIMPFLQGGCGVKMYLGGLTSGDLQTIFLRAIRVHTRCHCLPIIDFIKQVLDDLWTPIAKKQTHVYLMLLWPCTTSGSWGKKMLTIYLAAHLNLPFSDPSSSVS